LQQILLGEEDVQIGVVALAIAEIGQFVALLLRVDEF
jgi:hypothetical protein